MTRDELVERMARAIVLSFDADPDWGNPPFWTKYREQAAAALTELEKHAVVVPAELTDEMRSAGVKAFTNINDIWRECLAARPR